MTQGSLIKKIICSIVFFSFFFAGAAARTGAAAMSDYCVTPPFIVGGVLPNLMLMLDNSTSMYDLNYADKGVEGSREPYYCYDQTFSSANTYAGYFDSTKNYQYDFTNNYFSELASLPSSCATGTAKSIASHLYMCVDSGPPKNVLVFTASGKYLNWLTSSKFDVQKKILTGGKYCDKVCPSQPTTCCAVDTECPTGDTCTDATNFLQAESRGCVGRKFIKEALTADYVEGGTNTSLGITFGVRGPINTDNPSALSIGGQTYLNIYLGDYNESQCQAAIDLLVSTTSNKQQIIDAIDTCLNNAATNQKTCRDDPKPACTQDWTSCFYNGSADGGLCTITPSGTCGPLGGGDCNVTTSGTCTQYAGNSCTGAPNKTCNAGPRAGASCQNNADCNPKLCTVGKVGFACSVSSECDLKTCENAGVRNGNSCVLDSECDTGTCTSGKPNTTSCDDDTDCFTASGTCSAASPKSGNACLVSNDCSYGPCLLPVTNQVKSTFTQSMNSCYQFTRKGQAIGPEEIQQVANPAGCNQIYLQYMICNGGAKDGQSCTADADCTGGGDCIRGPDAIRPGSPVLLCSSAYAGYCASTINDWVETNWNAREYADYTACITAKYEAYCGAVEVPPVVDPTDAPSETANYDNLPAIIGDIGIEAQLNAPAKVVPINIQTNTAPEGLIKDFIELIRFGAMSFDYNGSISECGTSKTSADSKGKVCSNSINTACITDAGCTSPGKCILYLPCPMKCSVTTTRVCTVTSDCPTGETCIATASSENLDGARVLSYVGDSVGDHNSGLIHEIDKLGATTWTPFSEAFYNAIGYFALSEHKCSATTTTTCEKDADCPLLETCVKKSRSDLRLNTTDFDVNKNPSQFKCQQNNILLITDGSSTADLNSSVTGLVSTYHNTTYNEYDTAMNNTCYKYYGTRNLNDYSWLAYNKNIADFTSTPQTSRDRISTFVVFSGAGDTSKTGECNPETLLSRTATDAGGTFKKSENPEELRADLRDTLLAISAKTASGTAASVLASGEGSGANLIQALFYPNHRYNNTDIVWTGVFQNLWYYIDPYLGKSSIREDTTQDKILNLTNDYIVQFTFAQDETKANLYADADGNGSIDSATTPPTPTVSNVGFSDIKYLWEAGKLLFDRTPGSLNTDSGARKIFTNLNDDITIDIFDETAANVTLLKPLVNVNVNVTTAGDVIQTQRLIRYVRGMDGVYDGIEAGVDTAPADGKNDDANDTIDNVRVRNRTVTIDGATHTWKLGDIVNATPKIVSWVPLNLYDKIYLDSTYASFTQTEDYKSRGMVFSGANDGMLHAFNLGLLGIYNDQFQKASIGKYCSTHTTTACRTNADCPSTETCLTDSNIGKEEWAFIPKNALPYLKYLADPDYCHLYYIDATPYVLDASINKVTDTNDSGGADAGDVAQPGTCTDTNYWTCDKYKKSWRTILIGGMRLGGACRNSTLTCKDCTKTPIADVGYSTYFALDITNPGDPTLLWEISNPALGYAMSGPAIVRIAGGTAPYDNTNKNGRWYVVFGSGPSGYVTPDHQFLGITEHNNYTFPSSIPPGGRGDLRLFVYDLKSGALLKTINVADTYTDLNAAFAGAMVNGAMDFDQNQTSSTGFYQDDAVYFGYTSRADLGSIFTARVGDGASNTIRLEDGSSSTAGFYNGQFIQRNDFGEETKLITSYSGSGGATTYNATVDSNWKDGPPTAATTYNIFPGWTNGGVLRLLTKQDLDPAQWVVSKVIDGIGPVTSAVAKLQNYKNKNLRLFFGSGRYFFKTGEVLDDANSGRKLYGVVEPCITSSWINTNAACSTTVTGALGNASTAAGSTDADGWYIALDSSTGVYSAERVTTDPLAVTTGAVFFTTSSPTADVCEYGGQSHLWAVKYDTGGSLSGTGVLKGKAIVQVSTGSIEEVDLSTAFTERQDRRSASMQGLPPSGGLSIVVPPKPVDKILHMRKH